MTSAALFGFKLAHFGKIKSRAEERQRLEAELAGLVKELEATLTPEVALQVEQIMGRRSSVTASHALQVEQIMGRPSPVAASQPELGVQDPPFADREIQE
jgi:hypothetical protein